MTNYIKKALSFIIVSFLTFSALETASFAYEVDKEVIRHANNMDGKYFPVFIESIKMIQNRDFKNLESYFSKDIIHANRTKKSASFANYSISNTRDIIYKDPDGILPSGYKVSFPIDWRANPSNDLSWSFYFQNLFWLDDYLSKGEHGDQLSALIAFKVIHDWLSSNPSWPPRYGPLVYDEHATILRLNAFYRALRLYEKSPFRDDAFSNLLLAGVLNHISLLASEELSHWHNRMILVDTSLIRIFDTFKEFKGRKELQLFSIRRLIEQFRTEYSSEGVHNEHSSCYHIWINGSLLELITYMERIGMTIPQDLSELVNKSSVFYTYILKPDGTWPNFGDCSNGGSYIMSDAPGKKYFADHPEVTFSLSRGKQGRQPRHKMKVFQESGYAIFRDTWPSNIYSAIKSEFHSDAHYHEDDTSLLLSAYEHELLIDPGIHTYNKGPFDKFMRRAEAHNVMLVDDKDYDVDFANTGLSGITRSDVAMDELSGIVELTHPHYDRLGVKTYRQFGQIRVGNYVLRDTYESSNSHVYSQLFHLAPGAKIELRQEGVFKVTWEKYQFSLWLKSNYYSSDIIEGSMDPVQGWYFPTFGKAIAAPVLKLKRVDSTGEFLTYICITEGASIPDWDGITKSSDRLIRTIEKLPRRTLVKETGPSQLIPARKITQ